MYQKLLGRDAIGHRRELVKQDTLVCRMLIDKIESLGVLCDDIRKVDLTNRDNRAISIEQGLPIAICLRCIFAILIRC